MTGLLLWIFGLLTAYLLVAEAVTRIRAARRVPVSPPGASTADRGAMLGEIRAFLRENGISEDWLAAHGGEREMLSCMPGSIFGRCARTMEFGFRAPFAGLDQATDEQLLRILERREALSAFRARQAGRAARPEPALAGQVC